MNLTPVQKSAVLNGLSKAIKTEQEKVREEADKEAIDLYENFGTDRMKINIGDTEIGVLSLTFSKDGYIIEDREAFDDFLLTNGLAHVVKEIRPEFMHEAIKRIEEETPGAILETIVVNKDADKFFKRVGDAFVLEGTSEPIPGIIPKPQEIKGARLTGCKPDVVMSALSGLPGTLDTLLLGGEVDE